MNFIQKTRLFISILYLKIFKITKNENRFIDKDNFNV